MSSVLVTSDEGSVRIIPDTVFGVSPLCNLWKNIANGTGVIILSPFSPLGLVWIMPSSTWKAPYRYQSRVGGVVRGVSRGFILSLTRKENWTTLEDMLRAPLDPYWGVGSFHPFRLALPYMDLALLERSDGESVHSKSTASSHQSPPKLGEKSLVF